MTNKFLSLLNTCNCEEIKDYILERELQFYENDMKDIIILLGSSIPNYDKFIDILDINENSPIYSELFTDEITTNNINIYKTNTYNLYFIREEQFGLKDEYIITNKLIFTNNNWV